MGLDSDKLHLIAMQTLDLPTVEEFPANKTGKKLLKSDVMAETLAEWGSSYCCVILPLQPTTAELCADSVLLFSVRASSLPWLVILAPPPSRSRAPQTGPRLRHSALWHLPDTALPHSQLKGNVGTRPRDRERTRVFSRTSRAFGDSDLGKNVRNPSLRVQLFRPPIPATTLSIFRQNYYAKRGEGECECCCVETSWHV